MQLQQVSFSVPAIVWANVERRARPLNIRPAEYARRLFEAAYAARIAGEKGETSGDAALDEQVRGVFLLADCEPEFIAESLGLPLERVKRILEGWRQVAREAPSERVAPATVGAGYRPEVIGPLWREGATIKEIAVAIGKTEGALSMWMSKNRDVCPKRLPGQGNGKTAEGRASDRTPAGVGRPAGAPAGAAGETAREAQP